MNETVPQLELSTPQEEQGEIRFLPGVQIVYLPPGQEQAGRAYVKPAIEDGVPVLQIHHGNKTTTEQYGIYQALLPEDPTHPVEKMLYPTRKNPKSRQLKVLVLDPPPETPSAA